MNFESKYLIRWGIPGWVLIFWMFYQLLFLKGMNPLESNLLDITKGFTLLISLTAIGVPLGYLVHQIYFLIVWVTNKARNFDEIATKIGENFPKHDEWNQDKNEDYFQFEYVWHSMLLEQEDEAKRAYIEGRYRHLLSTTHSLGALFVSSFISLLITSVIVFTHWTDRPFNPYFLIGFFMQFIIMISAVYNHGYYSDNVRAFQIKILKKYL